MGKKLKKIKNKFRKESLKIDRLNAPKRIIALMVCAVLVLSVVMPGTLAWQSSPSAMNVFSSQKRASELEVNKKIENTDGSEITDDQKALEFIFEIVFSDDKEYSYSIDGGENQTLEDGTFKLKHGEVATFKDIPIGITYTVTEQSSEGYTTTATGDSGTIDKEDNKADFINYFGELEGGKLVISKIVVGTQDAEALATSFDFKVTIGADGADETMVYPYAIYDESGEIGNGSIKSGEIISLKHGQWAMFENLENGIDYTIEEEAHYGFNARIDERGGRISLAENRADFINEKDDPEYGKLIVSKKVVIEEDSENKNDNVESEGNDNIEEDIDAKSESAESANEDAAESSEDESAENTDEGTEDESAENTNEGTEDENAENTDESTEDESAENAAESTEDENAENTDESTEDESTESIKENTDNENAGDTKEIINGDGVGNEGESAENFGGQIDLDKAFDFTIIVGDETYTCSLKDGETYEVNNIPIGMPYEVVEADYSSAGYVTSVDDAKGTIGLGENRVEFINTLRQGPIVTPTPEVSVTPEPTKIPINEFEFFRATKTVVQADVIPNQGITFEFELQDTTTNTAVAKGTLKITNADRGTEVDIIFTKMNGSPISTMDWTTILTHGDTFKLVELNPGEYEVAYYVQNKVNEPVVETNEFTIDHAGMITINCINTKQADPSITPTVKPTPGPTTDPKVTPTAEPTPEPTIDPKVTPTVKPTPGPTIDPRVTPTVKPTPGPTTDPKVTPTVKPTPTGTSGGSGGSGGSSGSISSGKGSSGITKSQTANTSDTNALELWIGLLIVSSIGLGIIVTRTKKKQR